MSYLVSLRADEPRLADDDAVLLRLGTDADIDHTIKASLGSFVAYQSVLEALGIGGPGALTLSVVLWPPGRPSTELRRGPFHTQFRTTTIGRVRTAGLPIWPTDVSVDGVRDPFSDVHFDLVVSTATDVVPDVYAAAGKAERRRLRELLRPRFEVVLDLFGPVQRFDVNTAR